MEPLAASALANLGKAQAWLERRFEASITHALLAAAFHDGLVEGASTAAAKEILAAGAVGPLVDALSRAHLRTQQVRSEAGWKQRLSLLGCAGFAHRAVWGAVGGGGALQSLHARESNHHRQVI